MSLFEQFLEEMRKRVSSVEYERYIKHLKLKETKNNKFVLETKNRLFQKWIKTNYISHIREILKNSGYEDIDIVILTKEKKKNSVNVKSPNNLSSVSGLSKDLTFDSFVVGESNKMAFEAAKVVANADKDRSSFNPLLIYGNTGLGKTHLLNAIGNSAFNKGKTITYMSAEGMLSEYTYGIKNNDLDSFKNKYRSCDYLLIDDIQFLSKKVQLQEEFFNTFETLIKNNKYIILTSDKAPNEIKDIDDRLKSRFSSGLPVDIHPPELETRIEIIKKKCEIENIKMSQDIIEFIASHMHGGDMRVIEGVLNNVRLHNSFLSTDISKGLVEDLIKNYIKETNKKINLDTITKVVSSEYNIKIVDLKSTSKAPKIAEARRVIFFLAKNLTSETTSYLAQYFNMKDHSSVSKALTKVKKDMDFDKLFKVKIDEIESKIKQKTSE